MRKTKDEAEVSRRLIINAAYKVFLNNGYSATKLSDIADEINMTRGVIYWHFKNKIELFICLFNEKLDESFVLAEKVFLSDAPLQEKLKTLLRKDESSTQFLELIKTFHPGTLDIDSKERDAAIKAIMKKIQAKFDSFSDFLSKEQKAGNIDKSIDIQVFSIAFFMITSMLHAPDPTKGKMNMVSIRSSKHKEIADMFWNGLGSIFTKSV